MLHAARARGRFLSPSSFWLTCALLATGCAGAGPSNPGEGKGRPQSCVDLDGDGYGAGCSKGWDCDDHDPKKNSDCGPATGIIDWVPGADAGAPDVYVPPPVETPTCPAGTVRVHVKDVWTKSADPTMSLYDDMPPLVLITDKSFFGHGARKESAGCDWYADCINPSLLVGNIKITPISPLTGCPDTSGEFTLSMTQPAGEIWIYYSGVSSTLANDAKQYPAKSFVIATSAPAGTCPPGLPDQTAPADFTKIHVRWPWADPNKTGFPGAACEQTAGVNTPPYPTSIQVTVDGAGTCPMQALLDFQDGHCPWYTLLFPNKLWVEKSTTLTLKYGGYAGSGVLASQSMPLPAHSSNEFWVAYAGQPDPSCNTYLYRAEYWRWYSQNPGPGWAGCGGDGAVKVDPCNPQPPTDFSVVHFRYIWAGQKTFTFFPKPEFMPRWMDLDITGAGSHDDIICWREADRPWFNCPVPNKYFTAGSTWIAHDRTRGDGLGANDWNTVAARPFPDTPGEYWLRWYYGKPDIALTSRFKFFEYYPDATNGDWSATGDWQDQSCAAKPPATPIVIGYPNAWFPYDETSYAYPFGASLARTYGQAGKVQDLLNALVWERYQLWKENWVKYDADACGAGTARVVSDIPVGTVSEGIGYGMAMSAAIGDKELFGKLWNFARHRLSQKASKYCGGLMGWMWSTPADCQPLDHPCDVDKGDNCGGNNDSAFDGDVDIGIGLVFAARQWPEYMDAALGWLIKMECEVDDVAEPQWKFPTPGDTWNRIDCSGYPGSSCKFVPGADAKVNMSYYPPGYFRVFGDFLAAYSSADQTEREKHVAFWYKTAESVYELVERCYDAAGVNPGLVTDWGSYKSPCSSNSDNYNWSRALWRLAVDAAWFGDRATLPENAAKSSTHYPSKSRMQAKIDNIQEYYSNFNVKNPTVANANRFSTICNAVTPAGTAAGCDPAYDHNSYFVNTAMCAYATVWDNTGATTPEIRREAIEEAVTATIMNDRYFQESLGVYTLLFLTGNFPNPMVPPGP